MSRTLNEKQDQVIRDRMKVARERAKLSQSELASAIGTALVMYGKMERGERGIRVKWLPKIAEATGVTIEFLMGNNTPIEQNYIVEKPENIGNTLDLSRLRPADRLALLTIYNSLVSA